VHQRYRQTDRRQTTDGSAIAHSEREREFTSAKNGLLAILASNPGISVAILGTLG